MRSHSVDAVAELLSVSREKPIHRETVLTWIRKGELAAVNISESASSKRPRYIITDDALAAFIERRSTIKSSPAASKPTTRKAKLLAALRDCPKHYAD